MQFLIKSIDPHMLYQSRGRGAGAEAGAKGGGVPIYDIIRMCVPNVPLFQRCQVYG